MAALPPSAAIHNSETIFRIPLQSPSCGAPEPHTGFQRCSKLSEHTEASEAVCVPQLPTQVCTKVLSMGQTKPSERAKQNSFTPGCSSPTHQNTPTPEVGTTTHHGKHHELVSCMLPQVPTLNKRQKTRAIGRCPQFNRVQKMAANRTHESQKSKTATFNNRSALVQHTCVPPERPLHLESSKSKVLTN